MAATTELFVAVPQATTAAAVDLVVERTLRARVVERVGAAATTRGEIAIEARMEETHRGNTVGVADAQVVRVEAVATMAKCGQIRRLFNPNQVLLVSTLVVRGL